MKKIMTLGAAAALSLATVAQASDEAQAPVMSLEEAEFVMSTQDMAGDMSGGGGEMIIPLIIVAILAIAATEGSGFCICEF